MSVQHFAMPDFLNDALSSQVPPIELLRQAEADLAQATKGRVQGTVLTLNPGGSSLFRHTFYLFVPELSDYTYTLFYVWHGPELYPANLLVAGGDQDSDTRLCPTEQDLRREIETGFQSDHTRQLVRALLVQIDSRNVAGSTP